MTDFSDQPDYAFDPGPPPEASRFLRNKGFAPAFSWQDVEPEEHAVAFSVAKATDMDVLRTIREGVQEALDDGLPFAEFQKRLKPMLQEKGWWGTGEAVDQLDGQSASAQLGSPRRLKTIYRANIRSARAAGQWERIERTKRALPYLVYNLGPSERHRPEHEAKEGLVLPVDDPFWDAWMPPNGWGCKCWVRQVTQFEAEEIGITETPDVPRRDFENRRTGEIKSVPEGIDPGWERNPGKIRLRGVEKLLTDRLTTLPIEAANVAARDVATSWMVRRILDGNSPGKAPVAVIDGQMQSALGSQTPVVHVSEQTAKKTRDKNRTNDDAIMVEVSETIKDGVAVLQDNATGTQSLVFEGRGDKPMRVIIKSTRAKDELFVSSFHRSTPAKRRKLLDKSSDRIVRE